jgi:hypothetical protein
MGASVERGAGFDVFVSHATLDARIVRRLTADLVRGKLRAWVDADEMRFGRLLRNEIQEAIRQSRVMVLVWSAAAARSRWVAAELYNAFHLNRFVVPCVIDGTPLPPFLQTSSYLDRRRDGRELGARLLRAIAAAPDRRNEVPVVMAADPDLVQKITRTIGPTQYEVLFAIDKDLAGARKANVQAQKLVKQVQRLAPLSTTVLNLAGYQAKNDYLLKHWGAVQAGRPPKDVLLRRGEKLFFESLGVRPNDAEALNGLASILMLERELDAAEFFQRKALALTKKLGGEYQAAQHDLDLILYYKDQARGRPGRTAAAARG